MNYLTTFFLTISFFLSISADVYSQSWDKTKSDKYALMFTNSDSAHIREYKLIIEEGIQITENFFGQPFKHSFEIFIHPNRESLDKQWQTDWHMPGFKSECWMVASGVSNKMDILSPAIWDKQACEHTFSNKTKLQRLVTHELVHVYHGQNNISSDFTETEGINWFIEGLATYVSGQCDSTRITDVKRAIQENKTPESLKNFWSGKLRYGFSGTMVMFIANKYGKNIFAQLLHFNNLTDILNTLNIKENELIENWEKFCLAL